MNHKNPISPGKLNEILRYEPDTGLLFWLQRPAEMFPTQRSAKAWNTRYAGKRALTTVGELGHLSGTIMGNSSCLAHRVIWAIMTGEWPHLEIDHINGVTSDNRWSNIRQVTRSQNAMNLGIAKNNKSGHKGVHWYKQTNRWRAAIQVSGKNLHLGYFAQKADAISAYNKAETEHFREFARKS